jgi:hypothetical protein
MIKEFIADYTRHAILSAISGFARAMAKKIYFSFAFGSAYNEDCHFNKKCCCGIQQFQKCFSLCRE